MDFPTFNLTRRGLLQGASAVALTSSFPLASPAQEIFTWAWVAIKICEGILAAIGAKVFDAVFGSFFEESGKVDFTSFLAAILTGVETIVHSQIEAEKKRELEASLSALKTLFNMYLNNRDKDYLVPLQFKATEISVQTASLGVQTIGAFGVCGSLELSIIQERYLRSRKSGEKLNISERADELINSAATFFPRLKLLNETRFSPVIVALPVVFYTLDGVDYRIENLLKYASPEKIRQDHIDRELERLRVELIVTLDQIVAKWTRIREMNNVIPI